MKLIKENIGTAEMQNFKENKKKQEKRSSIERRQYSYTYQIPERRNKNRGDRRKNSVQKKPIEKT